MKWSIITTVLICVALIATLAAGGNRINAGCCKQACRQTGTATYPQPATTAVGAGSFLLLGNIPGFD